MVEREPRVITDEAAIQELTTRAIADILPSREALADELRSGRRLSVYMGIDPTAPDIHIGHESQLLKLQRFQRLGHKVTLLIGDFTAMIGDPTDKTAQRVRLTREQVLENAEGYRQQAGKILDFDDPVNPVDFRFNSEWLGEMDFADVLELASQFTVQQMSERDMFKKRMEEGRPVSMVEFLYPMMQGWDSVNLGVDVEVGGSDQIFNMLAGSTLVRRHLGKQKFVVAGQLLADPGGRKMGKTEGNMITLVDTPLDMYHKVMLMGDSIVPHALELCTQMPMEEIQDIRRQLESGEMDGLTGKKLLARTIVGDLHGEDSAQRAEEEYDALTDSRDEFDKSKFTEYAPTVGQNIVDILVDAGLATSKSHARRLLDGDGVRIDGEKITRDWAIQPGGESMVLQVGKKRFENHRLLTVRPDQSN